MLPSLCPDSQLWLRDAQSDLHLGELWMWPDPKTRDWGRCYCAPEMEWPLSCTDSKGPGAKRQQWRSPPISISAGISRERRWLEPNGSVWSASCLPSELIVSIDPLSPPHKHRTLLHNQKVHRPGIDERSAGGGQWRPINAPSVLHVGGSSSVRIATFEPPWQCADWSGGCTHW